MSKVRILTATASGDLTAEEIMEFLQTARAGDRRDWPMLFEVTDATAIGLDVVLPDRSFDAIVPGYDRKLLAGIVLARF